MENLTLKEYFINHDTLELKFTNIENFNIFIDYNNNELCIELCDNHGNSVNIGNHVDIDINTEICDITETVLNYIIGNYLYNYC